MVCPSSAGSLPDGYTVFLTYGPTAYAPVYSGLIGSVSRITFCQPPGNIGTRSIWYHPSWSWLCVPWLPSNEVSAPVTGLPFDCRKRNPDTEDAVYQSSISAAFVNCSQRRASTFTPCIPWPLGNSTNPKSRFAFSRLSVSPGPACP